MSDGKSPEPSNSSRKPADDEFAAVARVSFPNSVKSLTPLTAIDDGMGWDANPFKMPPDSDIFVMRDRQRLKKKMEREKQAKLQVHEKMTYATKVSRRSASRMIHIDEDDKDDDEDLVSKDDPEFTIAVTRDRHVEKESLADYINKKREMFLVQYSLGVKRDEMRKLEEIAQAEERKLELAEQYLEEDASMFDEFLKENDRNSVEAIKAAEAETKLKLERVSEIKKLNTQMMSVKSDISKYEDMLKEYQLYKKFLDNLTPNEWKDEDDMNTTRKNEDAAEKKKLDKVNKLMKNKFMQSYSTPPGTPGTASPGGGLLKRLTVNKIKQKNSTTGKTGKDDNGKNSSPEPPSTDSEDEDVGLAKLYFTEPCDLLDIFAELEEHNLSLIQNSQETEEALEEMKQTLRQTEFKMEKETEILKEQINKLNTAIEKEESKASKLEMKSKLFSFGEFKADAQEQMLAELDSKVEDVYRGCIGDNEASISTLQMLTNIENRLEELFETIEMMPSDKVEAAEKAKEKDRRIKLREEKMEQQRQHQEERVRRALERAKAEPKKKFGKRLVFRSEPPRLKKKQDKGADQASREEEELAYYFQW